MSVYELECPSEQITFKVERLRRQSNELIGELSVLCSRPTAKTVNGVLSCADYNFSSAAALKSRAKDLAERAGSNGSIDWISLLDEFRQGVFASEREGDPAVDIRLLSKPERGDEIKVEGLVFPRRHPSILFGDGGAAKSYTALWIAGHLAKQGMKVGLFDWELSGEDHRDRWERLFGSDMPLLQYCRCDRPLPVEADRLSRVVRDHQIDYAVYDSVAFACAGRPEDAEVASEYFRAVRQIGPGSLHIAHINKSESNDQKPFGSSFWHNGSRSTWFVTAAERGGGNKKLHLGFFNRKANLGALCSPVSLTLTFTEESTTFSRANVADNPDLCRKLTVRQQIWNLLRRGVRTSDEIALEINHDVDTVKRTLRRYKEEFIALDGGGYALKERNS